jgi:hypothetical protein
MGRVRKEPKRVSQNYLSLTPPPFMAVTSFMDDP